MTILNSYRKRIEALEKIAFPCSDIIFLIEFLDVDKNVVSYLDLSNKLPIDGAC